MARGGTTLESHKIGGDVPPRVERQPALPPKINVSSGGKGGTVVLITGTLFIGYLYFTRRLPNVFKAIATPPMARNIGTAQGGVPPVTPKQGMVFPAGYPKRFTLTFPPPYSGEPVDIAAADPITCRFLVQTAVIERTGSASLAAMYTQQYCG